MSIAPRVRRAWQPIDGVVLLDKPTGVSSNHALQAVRRLYNAAKGGHTGTLDPLASGLLPLCFGEATKFSGDLLHADKRYLARVRLGIVTDTADAEGRVLDTRPVSCDAAQIRQVIDRFVGPITQVPPMYSALKRDGKPLYAYAREGQEVERAPRPVTIHAIDDIGIQLPDIVFSVHCSKGTYIRTLAADIGEALGCGAHLAALRRTAIGPVTLGDAVTAAALEAASPSQRAGWLLPVDYLLRSLPVAELPPPLDLRLGHGQAVPWHGAAGRWRVQSAAGVFLGVARLDDSGMLHPERLCAPGTDGNTPPAGEGETFPQESADIP